MAIGRSLCRVCELSVRNSVFVATLFAMETVQVHGTEENCLRSNLDLWTECSGGSVCSVSSFSSRGFCSCAVLSGGVSGVNGFLQIKMYGVVMVEAKFD